MSEMSSSSAGQAITLPEQLTLAVAAQTLQALQRALGASSGTQVVLDAAPMKVFDTSAVAVLLELRNRAAEKGLGLKIQGMPERLQALVSLYGVAELLPA